MYLFSASLFISARINGLILKWNSKLRVNEESPTKENWLNYTIERNKATQLVDETRMSFEMKICADINPSATELFLGFWQNWYTRV